VGKLQKKLQKKQEMEEEFKQVKQEKQKREEEYWQASKEVMECKEKLIKVEQELKHAEIERKRAEDNYASVLEQNKALDKRLSEMADMETKSAGGASTASDSNLVSSLGRKRWVGIELQDTGVGEGEGRVQV